MDWVKKGLGNRVTLLLIGAFAVGAIAVGGAWAVMSAMNPVSHGSEAPPAPSLTSRATPSPAGSSPATPESASLTCATDGTKVSSAKELTSALLSAKPGSTILLSPGTYVGHFVASVSGIAEQPISLCGPSDAVLDGGATTSGYVVHLNNVSFWRLVGFSVHNGQKGVVADRTTNSLIAGLTLSQIGDEAIHLRTFSSDNTVADNRVSDTGLLKQKFGEGIYVGTAQKNWCSISNCQPDASDRNVIRNNTISNTTAENIDIKEGTTGGTITGNSFDGVGMVATAATAWVNVKGNRWIIDGNKGTNSPKDGFQTHQILAGWGTGNVFRNNSADVNGSGFGFGLTPVLNNHVECNNTVSRAARGVSNVSCIVG